MSRKLLKLAIISPLLWLLVLMSVLGPFSAGYANAQVSEAVADSLTTEYFLLKHDFDLLSATTHSVARLDSLDRQRIIDSYEARLAFEADKRKHTYITILVTAVMTGTLAYVLRTVD